MIVYRKLFERKCYRKLLRVSWTQKMTNQELCEKIDKHCNCNLLPTVIDRKLQLCGHMCRISDERILKTLVFGMLDVPLKYISL